MKKKIVTIFFDLEGWWGHPARRRFNMKRAVLGILKVLEKHEIKAVFNTCGIVVENFPDMIKKIHNGEHEIASHGYAHENFVQLEQMRKLDNVLGKTERLVRNITGEKPIGIRSPWLFCNERVYSVLERRGYKWVSNRNVFRTELLKKSSPQALFSFSTASRPSFHLIKYLFFGLLWKTYKKEPFKTGGLLEMPLLSSQDGELLGLVDPKQKSPKSYLDFAYEALKTQFDKSGKVFNLNFHPWLIGSANRPVLLKRILNYVVSQETEFVLPRDMVV